MTVIQNRHDARQGPVPPLMQLNLTSPEAVGRSFRPFHIVGYTMVPSATGTQDRGHCTGDLKTRLQLPIRKPCSAKIRCQWPMTPMV